MKITIIPFISCMYVIILVFSSLNLYIKEKKFYNELGDNMAKRELSPEAQELLERNLRNQVEEERQHIPLDNLTDEEFKDLLDPNSPLYRQAELQKRQNNNLNKKKQPLITALNEAVHLQPDKKEHFLHLADLYLDDMSNNLFSNQFQLHEKHPTISIDDWNEFLNDRIVSVYIQKHKRTLLRTAAEDNLSDPFARNKRDNLKLIENLQEQDKQEQEKNIVIIRLPSIYDEEE